MQLSDERTHLAKALARAQAAAELRLYYEPHMSWVPLKTRFVACCAGVDTVVNAAASLG